MLCIEALSIEKSIYPSIPAYRYQFEEIYIHFGTENNQGSEHQIHGYAFPSEVGLT
jgi:hypothetical protein